MNPCIYFVYYHIKKILTNRYGSFCGIITQLESSFWGDRDWDFSIFDPGIPDARGRTCELPQSFAVASQPSGTHQNSEPRRARARA